MLIMLAHGLKIPLWVLLALPISRKIEETIFASRSSNRSCQSLTSQSSGEKSGYECFFNRTDGNFVRQKVAVGEYETASEVVREALRLLRQRDEVWRADVRSKITQGMDSIRIGRTIPSEHVKTGMAAFKKKWKKSRPGVVEHPVALARMERVKGIEPSCPAWEAGVLPLNYTRI